MSATKIEITDYYVMLNLHKALIEAKFHVNPDNINVSSSPIIADFMNTLIDTLSTVSEEIGKTNRKEWETWRLLSNQSLYRERAVKLATQHSKWIDMDVENKKQMTKNLLSPFIFSDEEIENFILSVDETFKELK
jgi:hypothetical protein